jgi:glycerol-3-phosphate dehydrogenase (NAD(P)+)
VAKLAVVGAGMMGSALCIPLADRGHDVRLVGTPLDDEIVRAVQSTGRHPRLDLELPEGVRCFAVDALGEASADADAFVVGVSSAGVHWAAEALAPSLAARARPVLMVSKGLELTATGVRVLSDVFADDLAARGVSCQPVSVCGPCIAGELARRVPTLVVFTGRDPDTVRAFADGLRTDYYHPRVSSDVVGVQVCAALKNAYAMGVGLGAGLHARSARAAEGVAASVTESSATASAGPAAPASAGSVAMHNYEAGLFAGAVVEMVSIVRALGGDPATAWGLAGAGDLNVTCNGGRTGRFGAWLGRGYRASEARQLMAGVTLECLEVLEVLERSLDAGQLGGLTRRALPLLARLIELGLHDARLEPQLAELFAE